MEKSINRERMEVVHDKNYIAKVKEELEKKSVEELTAEEKWRLEHVRIHEKHQGHETMHAEMILILLVILVVAQVILVQWKQRHFPSYQIATLFGMWTIPLSISIRNHSWRFIFFWTIFSTFTGLIWKKSLEKPLDRNTPRLVYKWFYFLYKMTYVLGTVGYLLILGTLFGINILFDVKIHVTLNGGLLFLFYSLYYGVLSRDLAEIASEKMACQIGYYTAEGIPTRRLDKDICAVCGNKILVDESESGVIESTYKLACEHIFHEFCIRGWCIVGKKQTCPYCKEKVDLRRMFRHPWERSHVMYGQVLDWIRWLVAWQPCIFFIVSAVNWVLGLE